MKHDQFSQSYASLMFRTAIHACSRFLKTLLSEDNFWMKKEIRDEDSQIIFGEVYAFKRNRIRVQFKLAAF